MVKAETELLAAAVVFILPDRTLIVLPGELIFQLYRNNGDTVHRQHHVNGIGVVGRIAELPCTAEDIRLIALHIEVIECGFGLEIADFQLDAEVFDAVAENIDQALFADALFKTEIELFLCVFAVVFEILRPRFRLCLFDEPAQHVHTDALVNIELTAFQRNISALIGKEESLDILFKAFFFGFQGHTSFLPVTYSYISDFLYCCNFSIFCCLRAMSLSIWEHLWSR